jgi:plasmid stabilization system protein ParE
MSGFVLHPDALTDLTEIWEFIAADNPGAADRVLEETGREQQAPNTMQNDDARRKKERVESTT